MWIVLSIIGFVALFIVIILLLPVKVIIKNDETNELILRYKLLFKTFGENPNPNDPIVKTLKKAGGVERLEKEAVRKNIRSEGLQKTVSDSYAALAGLLRELVFLLGKCTITRLHIKIRSTDEDPSQAAILYGVYTAATHTLLNILRSFIYVRKRGCKIDIGCDFNETNTLFRYYAVLSIPVYRVLAAFWRVALEEVKRADHSATDQTK